MNSEIMVGIVILNYINWEDSYHCIKSIINNTNNIIFKIYLVDNCSPNKMPNNIKLLLQHYNNIEFILAEKNLGYSAGNNLGIAKAKKDYCKAILIANNDVRFTKDSIEKMFYYLQKHNEVGIVGPMILDQNKRIQKQNLCKKTGLKEKYFVRTRLNIFFRKQYREYFGIDKDYRTSFPVFAVLGCCFMISDVCVEQVMPLDENTFLYEEELILGIKMEEANFKTMYFPKSIVYHLHGKSTKNLKAFAFQCNVESELYYCKNYLNASLIEVVPLYLYRVFLYFCRCIKYKDFRKNKKQFLSKTYQYLLKEYRG